MKINERLGNVVLGMIVWMIETLLIVALVALNIAAAYLVSGWRSLALVAVCVAAAYGLVKVMEEVGGCLERDLGESVEADRKDRPGGGT